MGWGNGWGWAPYVSVASRKARAEKATAALRHFAGVLLHGPSVRARELADSGRRDEFLDGLHAVFGIDRPA